MNAAKGGVTAFIVSESIKENYQREEAGVKCLVLKFPEYKMFICEPEFS